MFLGVAQFGSVLEWGSRGRRFESSHPDFEECLQHSFFFAVNGYWVYDISKLPRRKGNLTPETLLKNMELPMNC